MLKKHAQLFVSTLLIFDSLVILFAWWAAYYLRFKFQIIAPVVHGIPEPGQYGAALLPIWIVFMVNIKICGLYQPLRGKSYLSEYYLILQVTSLSVLMLTAISFFYREVSYSRLTALMFWGIATTMMALVHTLSRNALMARRKKGVNLRQVLIVGTGALGQAVAEKIDLHPEIGFSVAGFLTLRPEEIGGAVENYKVLGLTQDISKHIKEQNIDQLFIALPSDARHQMEQALDSLGTETVDIKVVPDLLRFMNLHSGVEDFDGLPVVNLTGTPLYGWNSVIKRTADIVCSCVAIVLASPLMLLIALLIKFESRGPVIYLQNRVGLDENMFAMLKFRSMREDAETETGPVWARESDWRRTRVGAVIRRLSLDELPQLFNVLKGDMSLVGPRPERPVFVDNFKKSIPHYMLRLKMKAGLTGWAQVNGWRGNTSLQKRIEYDLYYIKNWSLWFDIKIMIMTLWKGAFNRHAY